MSNASMVATEPRNALGLSAVIVGTIGILFGLVPATFWIAGPLAVTALGLGFAGYGRTRRKAATNRKTALAGVITGVVAAGLSVWGAVVVFTAINDASNDLDKIGDQLTSYSDCLDQTPVENISDCDYLLGQ